MAKFALFSGLISDENDAPVETETVGSESFYVANDAGFRRYISSEIVDRQILKTFTDQMEGKEDFLSEQAATMMGQDDIFTIAILKNQLKNIDQHIDTIFDTGIPEEARAYIGMMGFSIVINFHGDVLEIKSPTTAENE
jgi:hypothetical protein